MQGAAATTKQRSHLPDKAHRLIDSGLSTGQRVKPFDDGRAANDEFQSTLGGTHRGELIRDLLRQRVRMPEPVPNYLKRPALTEKLTATITPGSVLLLEAPSGYGKTHALSAAFRETSRSPDTLRWLALTGQENDSGRCWPCLKLR